MESAAGFSKVNIRSEPRRESHGAMRLNVTSTSNVHKELVACVGWNAFNELYSCGDDKTVSRWDINGDAGGKVRTDRCPPQSTHPLVSSLPRCRSSSDDVAFPGPKIPGVRPRRVRHGHALVPRG